MKFFVRWAYVKAPQTRPQRNTLTLAFLSATLLLISCGESDDDDSSASFDSPPEVGTTDGFDEPSSIDEPPEASSSEVVDYDFALTTFGISPEPVFVPEAASGQAEFRFDRTTNGLTGGIMTSSLSGTPTSALIFQQWDVGEEGFPILALIGDGSGAGFVLPGDTVLNNEEANSLISGLLYSVVQTELNPAGEIRGQFAARDGSTEEGSAGDNQDEAPLVVTCPMPSSVVGHFERLEFNRAHSFSSANRANTPDPRLEPIACLITDRFLVPDDQVSRLNIRWNIPNNDYSVVANGPGFDYTNFTTTEYDPNRRIAEAMACYELFTVCREGVESVPR